MLSEETIEHGELIAFVSKLVKRITSLERVTEALTLDINEMEEEIKKLIRRTELELPQQNYDD